MTDLFERLLMKANHLEIELAASENNREALERDRDELLAACEALMPCFVVRNDGPNTWDTLALITAYNKARDAITKVKGE